jgi:hypothetical protein
MSGCYNPVTVTFASVIASRIPHLCQVASFTKALRDCFLQNVSVVATSFDDDQGSGQGLTRHRDSKWFYVPTHSIDSPYRIAYRADIRPF